MRRTILLLLSTMTIAVLVVSGAMLFGMDKPAQAQSDPEPPCNFDFCLDKTATPNPATVGEPITFTITERCPGDGCGDGHPLVDQLPSGLSIDSVDDSQPNYQCSSSGNTVTCPSGGRLFGSASPFTLTIVASPTKCGTFTNTASIANGGATAKVTFTVLCPDTRHPRVISTVPTRGASGVAPGANVKATFSEDMNASSLSFGGNGGAFKLFKKGSTTKVGATVSYNPNKDMAILNPNNSLKSGATYKAIVTTAARDKAGNRLDQKPRVSGLQPKVWFFTVRN